MIRDINSLSPTAALIAYIVLGIGFVAAWWFVIRYMIKLPWFSTEEGRHLVAMTSVVGAFFTLYLITALFPNLPGEKYIKIGLMVALVGTLVWRVTMLERAIARRERLKRAAAEAQ